MPDEIEAFDLPVSGSLPPELTGRYLRNGPNPWPGRPIRHGFVSPGMLHGVRLIGGRAEWYRSRWVRTRALDGAPARHPDGSRDLTVNSANTHIIEHGGRLLALCEDGVPYRVDHDLGTVDPDNPDDPDDPDDLDGRLRTAMTAHPKEDPATGELHFCGYGFTPPYVTYHRMPAAGRLEYSRIIDVPEPTMMHDFAITERYVIWLDLPATFDRALVGQGVPVRWNDEYGARLGVLPRAGEAPVRWFDIEPCYVFHVGNAREDAAGRIVLDAVRYDRATWHTVWSAIGGATDGSATAAGPVLHRWTLDPAAGTVTERRLDDRCVEFPTLHAGHVGRGHRYLYLVAETPTGAIIRHDAATGAVQTHDVGPERVVGEAAFVPAEDARAEDEGWLLSIATDRAGTGSELLVLDATDVAAGPVASVRLPRAVPAGFHGSWIADGATR